MPQTARPASFAIAVSEIQGDIAKRFLEDGRLNERELEILVRMSELYAEAEALDVIRLGAVSVLNQGKPSGKFPRRVREVIRDLSAMIEEPPCPDGR